MLSAEKANGAYLRAFHAMELGGLEPPTSWVRLRPVQFALVSLGLVGPNPIRRVLGDSLSSVARLVARTRVRHAPERSFTTWACRSYEA
jgi:hypothetical protein